MTENNDIGVFTAEFRHEVVVKFVKDLAEGNIRLMLPTDPNSEIANSVAKTYVTLSTNIVNYVSGKEPAKQNELEEKIFSDIMIMRISGTILKNENSPVDKDIENINKKIDSTNFLLRNVLMILLELSKKFDKQ